MRRVLTIALLVVGVLRSTAAGDEVIFPSETTVSAGKRVAIPISGTLNTNGDHAVRIEVTYDPRVMNIVAAAPVTDGAFRGAVNVVDRSMTSEPRARVVLDCRQVVPTVNGPICEIIVEGTYGPDDSGTIEPVQVQYDYVQQPGSTFKSGIVRVDGQPPARPVTDGIQGNYPNPFSTSTTFVVTLGQRDVVTFSMFDTSGRDFGEPQTYTLDAGTHLIEFAPDTWKIGNGAWLVRMTTSTGTFVHPFTFQK